MTDNNTTPQTTSTTNDNMKQRADEVRCLLMDVALANLKAATTIELGEDGEPLPSATVTAAEFNGYVAFLDKMALLEPDTHKDVNGLREALAKKQKHSRLHPAPDTSEHDARQKELAKQRALQSHKEGN